MDDSAWLKAGHKTRHNLQWLFGNIAALDRMHFHMHQTGKTYAGRDVWSASEIETLRRLYPDYSKIARSLPRRSLPAIKTKARDLRINPRQFVWSRKEIAQLKHPYTTGMPIQEIMKLFPGKTAVQIQGRVNQSKYHRPGNTAPIPTGMALLDSIRNRAHLMKLTGRDLDFFVKSSRHFERPRSQNWRALAKALKFLSGGIVAVWPDEK